MNNRTRFFYKHKKAIYRNIDIDIWPLFLNVCTNLLFLKVDKCGYLRNANNSESFIIFFLRRLLKLDNINCKNVTISIFWWNSLKSAIWPKSVVICGYLWECDNSESVYFLFWYVSCILIALLFVSLHVYTVSSY